MQTLQCDPLVLRLRLPDCSAELTQARLTRRGYEPVIVGITIESDKTITLEPPEHILARGVWSLLLDTDCGCFSAPIWVEHCNAPGFEGRHHDDDIPGITPVCCDPEEDLCVGEVEP